MKKIKQMTLLLLLGIFTFVGMNVVNAEGFTVSKTLGLVCNPAKISKGGTTECYMHAIPDGTGSLHGFVTAVFTTDELEVVDAVKNPAIANSAVAFQSANTLTGSDTFTDPNLPNEIKQVKCVQNTNWKEAKDPASGQYLNPAQRENIESYACAIFYSTGANAFTPSSIKAASDVRTKVLSSAHQDHGIIGGYKVKLKEDATGTGACGHVCVKAWGVETLTQYAQLVEATGGGTSAGSQDTPKSNVCQEIHKEGSTLHPGITPETGAFTSYAVLAAGALIAIGAIAIAKKNNRFNRI